MLAGYVDDTAVNDDLKRSTKIFIDDDLEELEDRVYLGFGFSYEEIPEFCNNLPAL